MVCNGLLINAYLSLSSICVLYVFHSDSSLVSQREKRAGLSLSMLELLHKINGIRLGWERNFLGNVVIIIRWAFLFPGIDQLSEN